MHNTQSRLPVNGNDVITLGATIGTFEAVVFLCFVLVVTLCSCSTHVNYIRALMLASNWPLDYEVSTQTKHEYLFHP